jgi:hypothetical protein
LAPPSYFSSNASIKTPSKLKQTKTETEKLTGIRDRTHESSDSSSSVIAASSALSLSSTGSTTSSHSCIEDPNADIRLEKHVSLT